MLTERSVTELGVLLSTVHPGQRIRAHTLLRHRVKDPAVADLLRDPSGLAHAVTTVPALSEIACAGAEAGTDTVIILRRRFDPWERSRAVVDLNNLFWTIAPETVSAVFRELRRCGVGIITGIGDANLPFVAREGFLEELRTVTDDLLLAPGGTPADGIILERARLDQAIILSNDMFRDWRRTSSWCRRNIHRLRVPVIAARKPGVEPPFSFGPAAIELRNPPISPGPRAPTNLDRF